MEDFVLYRPGAKRFRDLNLNFCGYEACDPLHGFGPAVRPNYIIHYILEGRGIYRVGDTTWNLAEGEGFLIEPGTLTFYQADAKEPWTYLSWMFPEGGKALKKIRKAKFLDHYTEGVEEIFGRTDVPEELPYAAKRGRSGRAL